MNPLDDKHSAATLAEVIERDYFPMDNGRNLYFSVHEWQLIVAGLRALAAAPSAKEQPIAPIHRPEWDGWIRFDSDCIINGVPVAAGTSWGPFAKSREASLSHEPTPQPAPTGASAAPNRAEAAAPFSEVTTIDIADKSWVGVSLTTHAALDLLALMFKENHYPNIADTLAGYKGRIQDKEMVRLFQPAAPSSIAAKEEVTPQMIAAGALAIDRYFHGSKDAPYEGSIRQVYLTMRALAPSAIEQREAAGEFPYLIGIDKGRPGGDYTGYACSCGQVRVSPDGPCERKDCPIPSSDGTPKP